MEIEGYRDLVEVGEGGFAVVYRATQARLERRVALKVLKAKDLDERARRRFEIECEAMGDLSWHPNVVAVHDSGFTTDGRPYLVMEFLEHGSLADRVSRDGRMGWADAVDVAVQAAGALGAVHAAGRVHRDVKPANLLVGPWHTIKLADFGIAAVSDASHQSSKASFTAHYVAPEVLQGRRGDERGDLYSLAATVHALIAGRPPFATGENDPIATVLLRVVADDPPRLDGVPDDLADLLLTCLAKDPDRRPASAAALGHALQAIQSTHALIPTELRLTLPSQLETAGGAPAAQPQPAVLAETVPDQEVDTAVNPGSSAPPQRPTVPITDRTSETGANATLTAAGATASSGPVSEKPGPGHLEVDADAGFASVQAPQPKPTGEVGTEPELGQNPEVPTRTDGVAPPRATATGDRHATIHLGVDPDATLYHRLPTPTAPTTRGSAVPAHAVPRGDHRRRVLALSAFLVLAVVAAGAAGAATIINRDTPPAEVATTTVDPGSSAVGAIPIDPDTTEVVATTDVGQLPQGVAATDTATWVITSTLTNDDGHVTRIDPETNEVIATIDLGAQPGDIAATNNAVWITFNGEGTVTRIDPETNEIVATIDVGRFPLGVAATDTATWVTNAVDNDNGHVTRINPNTNQVVATIDVGRFPEAVAATDTATWIANNDDRTVTRVDPDTNEVVATIDLGAQPVDIAATNDAVWITSNGETVTRIDPGSNRVVATIDTGGFQSGVAATDTATWVGIDADQGSVVRIDPDTNQVVATVDVDVDRYPLGVAATDTATWVATANFDNEGAVNRIDPGT